MTAIQGQPCFTRLMAQASHFRRSFPEPPPTNFLNPTSCGRSSVSVISLIMATSLSSSAMMPILMDGLPTLLHARIRRDSRLFPDSHEELRIPSRSSFFGCVAQSYRAMHRKLPAKRFQDGRDLGQSPSVSRELFVCGWRM